MSAETDAHVERLLQPLKLMFFLLVSLSQNPSDLLEKYNGHKMFLFSLCLRRPHKYLVSLEGKWNLFTNFSKNFQSIVLRKCVPLFWKFCTSTERHGGGNRRFLQLNNLVTNFMFCLHVK